MSSGLNGEHADEGLDLCPDGVHSVAGANQVEVGLSEVVLRGLEGDVVVAISIIDRCPES